MDIICKIQEQGFCILEDVYSEEEVQRIIEKIGEMDMMGPSFRRTSDLFAIRRFLHEVSDIEPSIFTHALRSIIGSFGPDYFPVKSIYFDKPGGSNWFVAYHQDLTIPVNKRGDYPGFSAWTVKQDQIGVQPPVDILENIFTIRIHLDDTDEKNGALRVVPGSHRNGIIRSELTDRSTEVVCQAKKGCFALNFHARAGWELKSSVDWLLPGIVRKKKRGKISSRGMGVFREDTEKRGHPQQVRMS